MAENFGLGFIPDGYTEQAYIAGRPRLHPPLRFSFRPPTATARAQNIDRINKTTDAGRSEQIAAEAVATHLVEWDLRDAEGNVVTINTANILRLRAALNQRLYRVVIVGDAWDEDPDSPDTPPRETASEADSKN